MFTIETRQIGPIEGTHPLTDYLLTNPNTGEWATILPERGGMLRQLVLRKGDARYTLISSPGSAQALLADETYASALMYPFPSRVHHGIYHFEGEDYVLPINEPMRNNALHGFVHPKAFEVVKQEATAQHAALTIRYDYAGDVPGYPFLFSLAVTYTLSEAGLSLLFLATNTGTTRCPAAFGWHPYFTLNNTATDELELTLPAQAEITLDDHMIPTGQRAVAPAHQGTFSLRDVQLDTPYLARTDGAAPIRTVLHWPAEQVSVAIEQSASMPYVVVYTPPRRDSIAIEPQTANVNAFNNGEGLATIEPGDGLQGEIRVRLV